MKKTTALVLILAMTLAIAGTAMAESNELTPQQADLQINYLFSNLKTFQQDETSRTWQYAVTDLDHNGQLELIISNAKLLKNSTAVQFSDKIND